MDFEEWWGAQQPAALFPMGMGGSRDAVNFHSLVQRACAGSRALDRPRRLVVGGGRSPSHRPLPISMYTVAG